MQAEQRTVEVHGIAELAAVRRDLSLYLRSRSLPARVTYDLVTCVQEASKNALRFAATPHGVQITVMVGRNEVLVTVRDHGAGLGLKPVGNLPPDPWSESGRGLFLLGALMDRVEFGFEGGTEVRLHKSLPPRAANDDRVAKHRLA